MTIQSQFDIYQGRYLVGQVARPAMPAKIYQGVAGATMRPGYGVKFNYTDQQWELPSDAADRANVEGIVVIDQRVLPATGSSVPTGSNSPDYIEYADGDTIYVCRFIGTIAVLLGEAVEYNDLIEFDQTGNDWVKEPSTARTGQRARIRAAEAGANGSIIAADIWGL